MRVVSLVCLVLLASLAWSQAKTSVATTAQQEPAARAGDEDEKGSLPDSASAVAPDAAVLTIKGLCLGPAHKSATGSADAACQVVITRAQFERLSTAIHANVPAQKRQLATSYPRMLAMAREAEQRGLDKQAHFEQLIAFARVQILSQELVHNIQDEAAQVPTKDIQDYYRDNSATFERASLERIMIPDIRQAEPVKEKDKAEGDLPGEARSDEKDKEVMWQEAKLLRARAVAGEDFAKLQKEAYESAGLSTPPPSTNLAKTRRASLQPEHQSVFDMKPGEISPVIGDAGGFYIYKLVAKEIEPLSQAEVEIHKTLESQRMRAMMQKVQDSATTDVNQEYFGPPTVKRPAAPKVKANEAGAAGSPTTTPTPK
jgi:PPIC-type PPIASE domain